MRTTEVILSPEQAFNDKLFLASLHDQLGIPADGNVRINPIKRSIDARSRNVIVRVQCEITEAADFVADGSYTKDLPNVANSRRVIVAGSGPAGLFAALRLIELGIKPIVLERGKDVRARRRDIAAINKEHVVNPESNYCFGEGGAGTYSDGKLYTRSKKRGDIKRILEIFVAHGANPEILYDAHPHIGTNKLPLLVTALRDTILRHGGEVHFNTRMTDIRLSGSAFKGVLSEAGDLYEGEALILATGHSARDVFEMLHHKGIRIEAKPFALGVRVEHSQNLIDRAQYHCPVDRGPYLPASSYALVHQARINGMERGVFSFCMCPGGFIVPSATSPGEVVVNGMSPSRRDSPFANSGIVVSVGESDFSASGFSGPLAGMHFQASVERAACTLAGGTQRAPAQRLMDFVQNKFSTTLLDTSYQPGLVSADLRHILPSFVHEALQQGFRNFGTKIRGYLTNDAQVVGVESRTSSPVKVPRDPQTLEHPQVKGLYPCGEGAGYAGGIVSAAMDGQRCAEAISKTILTFK